MKTAQLSGSVRANVGKKDAAAVRNAEMVPCVLYGQGEQTHFAVKRNDIEKIVFSPNVYQVALDIDGKKAAELNIIAYPTNFLLDENGIIIAKNIDPITLEKLLEKILKM